jgi:predicted tellurium resistance membrane protein TerC
MIIGIIGFIVFLSILFSVPVMLLWNGCLVDAVDGIHEIGIMQAWGLSLLFGILFKSNVTNGKN